MCSDDIHQSPHEASICAVCSFPQHTIQVPHCNVTLDTKDPRCCALLCDEGEQHIAQVHALYALPDHAARCSSDWWVEFSPLYSISQLRALHQGQGGAPLTLPRDVDDAVEVVRGLGRRHAPLTSVTGGVVVQRGRGGMGAIRLQGGGRFYRYTYDEQRLQLVACD